MDIFGVLAFLLGIMASLVCFGWLAALIKAIVSGKRGR